MIRYSLVCDAAHDFESWFPSSDEFDRLKARGLVTCPNCGSASVDRAVMAPAVARTDRQRVQPVPPAPVPSAAAAPVALMSEQEQQLRRMITELHRQVRDNAEAVGPRFAEEALRIHHGESESRAIYGQANLDEARMLHEEGVAFLPLPPLPESGN